MGTRRPTDPLQGSVIFGAEAMPFVLEYTITDPRFLKLFGPLYTNGLASVLEVGYGNGEPQPPEGNTKILQRIL